MCITKHGRQATRNYYLLCNSLLSLIVGCSSSFAPSSRSYTDCLSMYFLPGKLGHMFVYRPLMLTHLLPELIPSFVLHSPPQWNNLPAHVVRNSSMHSFKKSLLHYLNTDRKYRTQRRVDADFQSFLSFREYAIRRNFTAAFTSEQGHSR